MKKFRKVFSSITFFLVSFIGSVFLLAYYNNQVVNIEEGKKLINLLFYKDSDFIILGSMVMFLHGTNFVQDFVYRKTNEKILKISDSFPSTIIILIIGTLFIRTEYVLILNKLSFLHLNSFNLCFSVFLLSFCIIFTCIFLYRSIHISYYEGFRFLYKSLYIDILICISVSIFYSFFITLFFLMIEAVIVDKAELGCYIISIVIIMMFNSVGEVFKKEEIED